MDKTLPAIDIIKMTHILKLRKRMDAPTILFLGARAGALFHSQHLYQRLGRFSRQPFDRLTRAEKFQACIQLLEQEDLFNETDAHYILLEALQDAFTQDTNRYVAELIRRSYFQLVITTSIDAGLEEALIQTGLHGKSDFEVFIPGTQSRRSLATFRKQNSLFTLAKMYGDLAVGKYNLKKRSQLLEEDGATTELFEEVQGWNMLMVGFDSHWDAAMLPVLFPCTGTLWYINEEAPTHTAPLFRYLQISGAESVVGLQGASEGFFRDLYHHIVGSTPLRPLGIETIDEPAQIVQPGQIREGERSGYPLKGQTPFPKTQLDVLLLTNNEISFNDLGQQPKELIVKNPGLTCYNLGMTGDATVFLMQVGSYPDNLEKMRRSLNDQVQLLAPASIILLGTAWGFKYHGQKIGDLLISEQILAYKTRQDVDRYIPTNETYFYIQRQRMSISTRLLNLFRNASIILTRKIRRSAQVTFGLIFSSTEAIDQKTAFEQVNRFAPDAIGIARTSAALLSVVQQQQEKCLLIAGISAYADEDTEQEVSQQETALASAAQFALKVIGLGGFHENRPQH